MVTPRTLSRRAPGISVAALSLLASTAAASDAAPLLFLGNRNLDPVIYLKGGVPAGVAVDIVRALAQRMPGPVEIRVMDWPEAQALVARGEADALIQINRTDERAKIYDFSDPLLESRFSIFVRSDRVGISGLSSLRGKRVGVESAGLPRELLADNADVALRIIPDFREGFRLVNQGTLDAVVVDHWVGSHVLAESAIRDIRAAGEPIAVSHSAIAVRKGNTKLLLEINSALKAIRADGTYQRVLDGWRPTEAVYHTREQITRLVQTAVAVALLVVLAIAAAWVATLRRELTRRRAADRNLELRVRELDSINRILAAAGDGIWVFDGDGRTVLANARAGEFFGFDPESAVGRPALEVAPEALGGLGEEELGALWKGTVARKEITLHSGDARERHLVVSATPLSQVAGGPAGAVAVFTDMTESRQAARYARSLIEVSLDPLVTISPEGTITDVNEATIKATGIPRERLIGTDFSTYFTEPAKAQEGYRQAFAEGSVTDYPLTIRHEDGRRTDVLYNASVYRDVRGEVLGVFAAARDVTERRRAEVAVAEERQRFNQVFETLPSYIILLTADYRVSYANRVFRERFGEPRGGRCYEYLFKRKEPCETCETFKVLSTGAPHHWEWLGPDGRNYDIHDFPFLERDGSRCILETGIDITERKRAEESVRQALREKETLLREIHHRVKNNMQVVSSLLDLQSHKISDSGLRALFQESQQRVKSMALVHEKLYQTKSLSEIDFRDYVRTIVDELSSFHSVAERKITTTIDVAPVALNLDLAIPCALVINELLTNAYKHAFVGRNEGEVRIGFREAGGTCALTVADDGVGLPEGFDWRGAPTLGLQLVAVLVRQLRGVIELATKKGVRVDITFERGGDRPWRSLGS